MKNKMVKKVIKGEKREFGLKEQYFKSFEFIRGAKNYIYFSIGLFILFVLIGFFSPAPDFLIEYINKFISEILLKMNGMSMGGLIGLIFLNNLQSSFFGMIFGVFLSVFPFFSIMVNGYLVGFVSSSVVGQEGFGALWRLIPHGIFELPAIFISFGMGLKLGSFILYKEKMKIFREFLGNSFRVFVLVIIPLLIVAAIIEGFLISLIG